MSQTEVPGPSSTATGDTDRVARFKAEVAEMKLSDPRAARDRMWRFVGITMMLLGIVLTILAYVQSSGATAAFNSEGPATQRDSIIIALIGLTVAVVGAAVFVRYSIAQFFRFWLARLIYEQQAQTDRVVEAVRR